MFLVSERSTAYHSLGDKHEIKNTNLNVILWQFKPVVFLTYLIRLSISHGLLKGTGLRPLSSGLFSRFSAEMKFHRPRSSPSPIWSVDFYLGNRQPQLEQNTWCSASNHGMPCASSLHLPVHVSQKKEKIIIYSLQKLLATVQRRDEQCKRKPTSSSVILLLHLFVVSKFASDFCVVRLTHCMDPYVAYSCMCIRHSQHLSIVRLCYSSISSQS